MTLKMPRPLVICLAAATAAMASTAQTIPAAAGGVGCPGSAFSDAPADNVDMKDFCFHPSVVRVVQGTTVTWRNADSTEHTVSGVSLVFGTYEAIKPGESVTYKFDKEGVFPYFCVFHPGMSGAVVVGTGARTPGSPSDMITRVNPTAAKVVPPAPPGSPAWVLFGLAGLGLLAVGFAGGRRLASR